jgi:hypothetical protein
MNKNKTEDNSYNDFTNNDRSFSNRTPLIEHYQNYSNPRQALQGSTSVPRPTAASGTKIVKDPIVSSDKNY